MGIGGAVVTEDERALRRMIRLYTRRRNWLMVRALLADLGALWETS